MFVCCRKLPRSGSWLSYSCGLLCLGIVLSSVSLYIKSCTFLWNKMYFCGKKKEKRREFSSSLASATNRRRRLRHLSKQKNAAHHLSPCLWIYIVLLGLIITSTRLDILGYCFNSVWALLPQRLGRVSIVRVNFCWQRSVHLPWTKNLQKVYRMMLNPSFVLKNLWL